MKHDIYFSEKERENLYFHLLEGKKQKKIVELICKDQSSISRKLRLKAKKKDEGITIYQIKHKLSIKPGKVKYNERVRCGNDII